MLIAALLLVVSILGGSTHAQRGQIFAAPPPECETVRGQPCHFPFKYRGKTYWECTYDSTTNGQPWCAYDTKPDGTAIPGKWEDCDTSLCLVNEDVCHTISGPDTGNSCKFPFTFNGQTYYSCALWVWGGGNNGKTWCSTKTDRFGNHVNGRGHYGFCGPNCPGAFFRSNARGGGGAASDAGSAAPN